MIDANVEAVREMLKRRAEIGLVNKSDIQQSVKVNGDGVAVDRSMRYRSMDDCPLNAKVLLLTNDGVAVLGKINAQEARKLYAGWFPLPKKDK